MDILLEDLSTNNSNENFGPLWSWLHGCWIYNYLCNQFLSPLMLCVLIPPRRGIFDTTLYYKVCQWLATGQWLARWFSPGTPVSSINKTNRHDITEILLKVALNPIPLFPLALPPLFYIYIYNLPLILRVLVSISKFPVSSTFPLCTTSTKTLNTFSEFKSLTGGASVTGFSTTFGFSNWTVNSHTVLPCL